MFNKVNNKLKKTIAVSLSLVSVMSSMTALAVKPSADPWQQDIIGNWSFIDNNGVAVLGWQNINGDLYYFDPDTGILVTNQVVGRNGTLYRLGNDGRIAGAVQI